jgi:outer membrane autotransporter protein
VSNTAGGTITGLDGDGVFITGDVGSVVNAGSIGGTADGVQLNAGGSINNAASGIISGGVNGAEIYGGPGSVLNAGVIVDGVNDGVYIDLTGTVTNLSGGFIGGNSNGVEIAGSGSSSVINSGLITGTNNNGVYFSSTGSFGTVSNAATGTIQGGQTGVYLGGDGNVVNAGTITGGSQYGVYINDYNNQDWVNNLQGGIIQGGSTGVYIDYPGSVTNAGTITGANGDGVYISDDTLGSTVVNQDGGLIAGSANGVEISSPGTVINSGTIIGTNNEGVYLSSGGYVTNSASGTIYGGGHAGVEIDGDTGSVDNAGSISGNNDGVYMDSGGTVNNFSGGTITGVNGYNGVAIYGDTGYVTNAGTISGNNNGVRLDSGGDVNNLTGGSITGNYGIKILGGDANVVNAGTIIGNSGTAILLDNYNNTVTFQTGSLVTGDTVGGNDEGTTDAAILQGHGEYDYNYYNFETLDVQGDAAAWNDPAHSWNLTGNSTFSVGSPVESGLLRINGSLTTPLLTVDGVPSPSLDAPILTNYNAILASDTTGLGGSGVIIGNVDNHGYVSPGNSIGTLTIIGSYTNAGNYYAEVTNSGASDHIAVSDAAVINGGNVIVEATAPTFDPTNGDAGIYAVQTKYTLLTATNGRSGMFVTSSIVQPTWPQSALFPLIGSSLLYDPTNVYLVLNRTPFNSVARTFNQNSVAGALDGVGVTGLSPTMANLLYEFYWLNSASTARKALDSLSGEIHGSMGLLDVQQQGAFNSTIAQRTGRISAGGGSGDFATSWKPVLLASAGSTPPPMPERQVNQPLDFWMQGIGSFGQLKNDGNATGGNYTISGMSGGMDYRVNPKLLVGLAGGYSHDNAGVGGPGANGTVDAYQIGAYGGYVSGPWHADGILSYGFLHTDTTRFINVPGPMPIHQQADGSYYGGVFSFSAEGGYAFKFDWLTVEPTIGLDYAHLFQGGFSETGTASDGNNYGLNVGGVNMDSVRSELGVRLAAQFGRQDSVQFIPSLHAVWEHEFADKYANLNASFVGGSGNFIVRGVELGADTAIFGGGLTVAFNKAIQGFVNFNASLNSKDQSSTISGGVSYSW